MAAENISGRDSLSPAEEDNLLSEVNSLHKGKNKVLLDALQAMNQLGSTMLSM